MSNNSVVIIGAGWAGLAAAVKLTQQGQKVTVYESAKQAGGRARSVDYNDLSVDNGQHILIGAYTECLNLMNSIGIKPENLLKRLPLQLTVIGETKLVLHAPPLPAPLHLLFALITAKGLNLRDKLAAVKFGLYLKKNKYHFTKDTSVKELFKLTKQTDVLVTQLWEPLCLATMNTSIATASANVFMTVFKDAFTKNTKDADSLLPRTDLSNLFPNAAVKYIKKNGGNVYLKSRIEKINIDDNKVTSINLKKDNKIETIDTTQLILAVAPQNIKSIISEHKALQPISHNIAQFTYQPIVTIYLQYSENTQLPLNMTGLSDTLSQWVFDRGSFCLQSGLFSVVISANGEHMNMDDSTLSQVVHSEISTLFTHPPKLLNSFVIREKRATFSCTVNINHIRPKNETNITGLYLAGDYTDTGYPATLEGAVRSGIAAAKQIPDMANKH